MLELLQLAEAHEQNYAKCPEPLFMTFAREDRRIAEQFSALLDAWDAALVLDDQKDTLWWNPQEIREHILGKPEEPKPQDSP